MRRALLFAAVLGCLALASLRSHASVAEQRSRLPPPAQCTDEVAGRYKAHVFYSHVGQWYRFDLEVRRAAPGSAELVGVISGDWWDGGPADQLPGACRPGLRRGRVTEPAKGSFRDGELRFEGTSFKLLDTECGPTSSAYLLDRFHGKLDAALAEFQSVLNADSPEWTNVPTVFRRVECFSDGQAASEEPTPRPRESAGTPPPYEPPAKSGCGC